MQKHSKWNWISGELVSRQIDTSTGLKGMFTSDFNFLGCKNGPRDCARGHTLTFHLLPRPPVLTAQLSVQRSPKGRDFGRPGFVFCPQ